MQDGLEAGARSERAAPDGGRYRYHRRSTQASDRERQSRKRILEALAAHKQLLSQCRARIRTLTGLRNETIAQAIEDGLRVSLVATAIGETVPRVRRIALSFDDRPPSTRSRDEHLQALTKVAADLKAAAAGKADVEDRLGVLVAHAYRLGYTDETHLAGMAGVSPESIHQNLRGLRRVPRRPMR